MPGDKPGTVAQQLTPTQVDEVVDWVRTTPNGITGPALLEKLQAMGVDCGLNAAYTFREKHIAPALDRIRSAREFSAKLSQELATEQGTIARGADMLAQQMVFDWMLDMSRQGSAILRDEDMQKQLRRLYVIVSEGMNAKDRADTTDARVKTSEARIEKLTLEISELKAKARDVIADKSLTDNEREARLAELFGR